MSESGAKKEKRKEGRERKKGKVMARDLSARIHFTSGGVGGEGEGKGRRVDPRSIWPNAVRRQRGQNWSHGSLEGAPKSTEI